MENLIKQFFLKKDVDPSSGSLWPNKGYVKK